MMRSNRSLPPSARPDVLATPLAYHGAIDYVEIRQRQISPDDVLDFSVNSNPFGPSPAVAQALRAVPLDRYPDRDCLVLRNALADHLAVAPEQIVVGNGTAELIHLVAFAFVQPGDRVLVIGPTFGEYGRAAGLMGANIVNWTATVESGFAVDRQAVSRLLHDSQPRLLFVCRPNNPTATILPLDVIDEWTAANPQTLFVVDEAYLAFAAGVQSTLTLNRPNIVVLRSMTKDYALAGLRLGYAIGHPQVINALTGVRPAWNVNALAQAAGVAALGDQAHLRMTLDRLRQATYDFVAGLRRSGLPPLPSSVHFFLVNVGNGARFRRDLLQRGILVRDCASFGLPAYVRIATRRPEENARLLDAIAL